MYVYVFGSGGVGGVGIEWVRGLGLGFTNPRGTWGRWHMCMCWVLGWCYVSLCCESGFLVLMAGPVFNHVAPYRYLLPNLYCGRYGKSRIVCVW